MALTVSLTLPATHAVVNEEVVDVPETTYPTAYARVLYSRVFSRFAYICVCWYADAAARFADKDAIKIYEYEVPTTNLAGDIYPAAYAYLKTLPEFAGAVDHLLDAPTTDTTPVLTPAVPVVFPLFSSSEAQA